MVTFPEWVNAVAGSPAPDRATSSQRPAIGVFRYPNLAEKWNPAAGSPAPPEPRLPPQPAEPHPPTPGAAGPHRSASSRECSKLHSAESPQAADARGADRRIYADVSGATRRDAIARPEAPSSSPAARPIKSPANLHGCSRRRRRRRNLVIGSSPLAASGSDSQQEPVSSPECFRLPPRRLLDLRGKRISVYLRAPFRFRW